MTHARRREDVAGARRVVVKVGSSSLTDPDGGGLDEARLTGLVDVLAKRRLAGGSVVLVSSGAIAAGIAPLGLTKRPWDLATQQAAASVGQGALVAAYQRAFGAHGLTVGQVLLTADDVTRRSHYTNAKRTLDRLLELGIVPIVNENDTVATQEIRFGDNDRLASLVAHLVHADALRAAHRRRRALRRPARTSPVPSGCRWSWEAWGSTTCASAAPARRSAAAGWSPRSRRPRSPTRPASPRS